MAASHSPARADAATALGRFDPILSDLGANAARHFGTPAVRLVAAQPQERPFSYLLRVAVCRDGQAQPASHLFVKVFKNKVVNGDPDAIRKRVVHDFATTTRVHAAMVDAADLGAVRPIACYPEHLAIVTEQAAGATLLEYLQSRTSWFRGESELRDMRKTMANVGRWLRVFQTTARPDGSVTIDQLREYLDHRLRQLVGRADGFSGQDRASILHHLDVLGAHVDADDLRAVPVHSDMSLGNILVEGHRVVVLDFAMARTGTRLHDLTRLVVQLDLLSIKPHTRPRVIRRLQEALLEGFDPALSSRLPLFRLHLLLHRVNHLLTLTVRRDSIAASAYNRVVQRQHRRWIRRELEQPADAAV